MKQSKTSTFYLIRYGAVPLIVAAAVALSVDGASAQTMAQSNAQGGVSSASPTTGPVPGPPQTPTKSGDELTEIVVTGTLIRGVEAPIGSELITLDHTAIQDSGFTQTADVISSLPFATGIGAGENTSNSSANIGTLNITRAQGINLRGLGDQATLTLLDGRRVPPGGEGAQLYDPNSIPAIALQRIEVLPDGASATYGSDAVAGVVNLILRKDFDGAEVQASDGFAKDFAGQDQFDAIIGHTWDGGSVMVAGEFFSQPGLLATSRPSLYNDNQTAYGASNLQLLVGSPGNITYNGKLYGLPAGSGVGLTPADFLATPNRTSQWLDTDAVPSEERHSGVFNFHQKLAEPVNLWVEGYYTERKGVLQNGIVDQTGIEVPATNPFYIPAAATACAPGSAALCDSVNYSFNNDFPQSTRTDSEVSEQLAVGLDVSLVRDFKLKVYGTWSQDHEEDFTNNQINQNGLAAALAETDPATALNVFGSGHNNPATLAMIQSFTDQNSRYDVDLLHATIDGPVYELPAGSLSVAVGGEYHRDSLHNYNFSNEATATTAVVQNIVNVEDSRTVASGFAEVTVPFFSAKNAVPGVQRLELDVAARFDHYSDFGSTTNPKIGLRWDPIEDVSTHASYSSSFRAPNLCDINPQCTSAVLTIPFPDLGWAKNNPPSIFGPGVSVTAIELGGNAHLQPERAKTYTFGVDYHPQALKGLTTSLDYYYINYKDIIDTPAAFNPAAGENPAYAQFVTRNPTVAQVLAVYGLPLAGPQAFPPQLVNLIVNGTRQNVGEALTDGLDLSLKYQMETSTFGTWVAGFNGTYVLKYDYQLVPGAPIVNVVNTVQGSGDAYPLRFTARGQLGWREFGLNVNGFLNFHNAYTNTAPPTPFVTERIASYTTFDLTAAYDTGDRPDWVGVKNLSFGVNVFNLFDRLPPFALIGTQLFDSTTGGPLGRIVTFQVRKRF